MEINQLEHIKKLAIVAIFSDDDLMERLVLKGGNAMDIIYRTVSARSSVDLDFSMEGDFSAKEIGGIENRIRKLLMEKFEEEKYVVFDVSFEGRPEKIDRELADFWGGYKVKFKIIGRDKYEMLGASHTEDLRRNATVVGDNQKRIFEIDISKFEYCSPKREEELDGYTIYVYTPEMIVCEKFRAICQQMPEYLQEVKKMRPTPRAKDFFDIYYLVETFNMDIAVPSNIDILKKMFAAKRVPIDFIAVIKNYKEYHRQNFNSVVDTVHPKTELHSFDFYFDYVVEKCGPLLKALGII